MSDSSNVIQFPKPSNPSSSPKNTSSPKNSKNEQPKKWNPSLPLTVCSLLAIALAAGATNGSFYGHEKTAVRASSGRGIASVEDVEISEPRDAAWEKAIGDSLASTEVRDLASIAVGHEPSLDENVRYGILEKYTILRDLHRNEVESIILQGPDLEPALIPNRAAFLGKYGKWMSDKYGFSQLMSSQPVKDHMLEAFTVFDTQNHPYAIARFELDTYNRLIAFHFQPL